MESTHHGAGFAAELIRQGVFDDAPAAVVEHKQSEAQSPSTEPFFPREPTSLETTGLTANELEPLVTKFLLNVGGASGRRIAEQLRLPFRVVHPLLQTFKAQMLLMYRNSAPMSDYVYDLSETGLERANRYHDHCTYFGAAPISLDAYFDSVNRQALRNSRPRLADMCRALDDLVIDLPMISQLGQAVNAGLALFLYGAPGNGKTSIAERLVSGLGQTIWVPRALTINGEIIRLFDSAIHEEVPEPPGVLAEKLRCDRRWVQIRRPTVVVGGEFTLDQLEFKQNPATRTNESPIQLKSNGGALVIDDFGRQRAGIVEMLNRWIVPLEKRYDLLTLPTGRQMQFPFEQLLVLATNIEPQKLIEEAFLRRIPYKIEVSGPDESQFKELFRRLSPKHGFPFRPESVDYLLERHYSAASRPMRFCHVRDLLLQARSFCEFHERPMELTPETLDMAVRNYFAGLQ